MINFSTIFYTVGIGLHLCSCEQRLLSVEVEQYSTVLDLHIDNPLTCVFLQYPNRCQVPFWLSTRCQRITCGSWPRRGWSHVTDGRVLAFPGNHGTTFASQTQPHMRVTLSWEWWVTLLVPVLKLILKGDSLLELEGSWFLLPIL